MKDDHFHNINSIPQTIILKIFRFSFIRFSSEQQSPDKKHFKITTTSTLKASCVYSLNVEAFHIMPLQAIGSTTSVNITKG